MTDTTLADEIVLTDVPNALVREAFLRSGKTAPEVAMEIAARGGGGGMRWTYVRQNGAECGDGTLVKRILGIVKTDGKLRETADYDVLWLIAEALGVDTWEVLP